MLLLAGTYTRNTDAEGVYAFEVGEDARSIAPSAVTAGIDNPSFLARHARLPVIYAVNEVRDFDGCGAVTAFHLDGNGGLRAHGQVSSLGADPCHLAVRDDVLVVSNYSGGNFVTFALARDGSISSMASMVQHNGKGVDPMRQKGPHVHSATFGDSGHLYVADLGIDRVMSYPVSVGGAVDTTRPRSSRLKPGAGPRHFCFDKDGHYAYLINELDNTMVSFACDESGELTELATVSTLPHDFGGASYCAHLEISTDGRFLYGSNRGHDSIVVFELGPDGLMEARQWQPSGGTHPRHFTLTPDARQLLVANRDSDNIVVFDRDEESGRLSETGVEISTPAPVCLLLV